MNSNYNMIVNKIVECIDYTTSTTTSYTIESSNSTVVADTTPEKPSRQLSSDSIEGCSNSRCCSSPTTINSSKKIQSRQHVASPVSVTNIFDHYDTALKSIEPLPYIDTAADLMYDDHVDEYFMEQQQHQQKRTLAKKRRVRFLLDEDGEIEEGVCLYSYPDYKITPTLRKECWYTKEDRLRTKADIQKNCREHVTTLRNAEEYRSAMITAIRFLIECDDDCEDVTVLDDATLRAMTIIVNADTRGMERSMQFHMGLPRVSTKTNVSAVLRIQTLIRELKDTEYDDYEVEELIADQCMMNSQFGNRWAKMIALGDEQDVKEQGPEEEDEDYTILSQKLQCLEIVDDHSDDDEIESDDDTTIMVDHEDQFC